MCKLRGLRGFYFVLLSPIGMTAISKLKEACPAGLHLQPSPPVIALPTVTGFSLSSGIGELTERMVLESFSTSTSSFWADVWRFLVLTLFCISGLAYFHIEKRNQRTSAMKS